MQRHPECPAGHGQMAFIAGGKYNEKDHELFVCKLGPQGASEGECAYQYKAYKPKCPKCGRLLLLRLAKNGPNAGNWFWGCTAFPNCRGTIDFSACDSCNGMRWLHMGNEDTVLVAGIPRPIPLIGHYGHHIESCTSCDDKDWDDLAARVKHAADCGCDHGMASGTHLTLWRDYPGRNDELYTAFAAAGFEVKRVGEDDIEILILPQHALRFNDILDREYMKMMTSDGPLTTEEQRALEKAHEDCSPLRCAVFAAAKMGDKNTLCPMSDKRVHCPVKSASPPPERFSSAAVAKRLSTSQTPTTGRTSCVDPPKSQPPRPDLPKPLPKRDFVAEVMTASEDLINTLNGMRFHDHPIDEQRKLEAARRELFHSVARLREARGVSCGGRNGDYTALVSFGRPSMTRTGVYILEDVKKLDDEAVLMGIIQINSQLFHAQFIEVRSVDGVQEPVNDPHNRYYDGVGQFNDCHMETTQVPGFPGNYVMFIFPMEG